MRHPWFNVRIAVVGAILLALYAPFAYLAIWLDIPLHYVAGGILLGLTLQYHLGKFRVNRSIRPEEFPRHDPDIGWVADDLDHLASVLEVPTPTLHLCNTGSPNAFAYGRKGNGHIVLDASLFAILTREEFNAVLAHELSHLRSRDIIPMLVGEGSAAIAYYIAAIAGSLVASPHPHRQRDSAAGTVAHAVVMCLVLAISRQREFVADADAKWALGNGVPMASALQKIERAHMDGRAVEPPEAVEPLCISGHWSMPALGSTHPPVSDRIDRLVTSKQLG